MNSKVLLCVLLIGAILIMGCSTSGGTYNPPPTGGAVAGGGGGCGRFADSGSAECDIKTEDASISLSPGF